MSMSTYLVAFVVGRLEITDPSTSTASRCGSCTCPARVTSPGSPSRPASSLRFFTEYYAIPYPDRKVDFVAIPDFAQGAMENTA